jgi:hypothetical protein
MLYPSIQLDPITATGTPNLLPSGTIALIPLDMSVVRMMQIILVQVSLTEDFGMQAWVSQVPAGLSLITPFPNVFPLVSTTPRPLIIFLRGQTPTPGAILAQVISGQYYLNVLNLTNSPTMFGFAKTNLT